MAISRSDSTPEQEVRDPMQEVRLRAEGSGARLIGSRVLLIGSGSDCADPYGRSGRSGPNRTARVQYTRLDRN